MVDFLFYLFSAIILGAALCVVTSRNPVNSAMFMILALVGQAAVFILLEAYFIAALQIIVYAGAVMVLFLFIIMLLNIDKVSKKKANLPSIFFGALGLLALAASVFYLAYGSNALVSPELTDVTNQVKVLDDGSFPFASKSQFFGYGLFTRYVLPFEVAGLMLLIAMIGVVVLSKKYQGRKLKDADQV